ncbi:TetR/AcrR family transcriptional regulator [Deinococcus sonorensis]|uniref:TetR/AcrR family transcriptional regulator n=2 Tax=Deinococcus sonorensis TaxID=309891 RepID=A0AAU7U9H7_9DEIO
MSTALRSETSTRERALAQAAQLFTERGYHGVSMREVAQAVGVTKPALYHHFVDKDALFLAVLEESLEGLMALLQRASTQVTLPEQLGCLLTDLLSTASQQRVGLKLAGELGHIEPARRLAFEQAYRRGWLGGVNALLDQAVQAGQLRADLPSQTLTRALMGMVYPLVTAGHPVPDPGGTARALLSIFLDGAGTR